MNISNTIVGYTVKFGFFALITTFYLACTPKVHSQNTLPPDVEALESIPLEFQGIFFSECDSSILHSMSDVIYMDSYFQFTTTLNRVQESESFENPFLYNDL
jgi:hypothetical protein